MQAGQVILQRIAIGGVFIFANIDSQYAGIAGAFQVFQQLRQTAIVKAQPIDDRIKFWQTKHARLRVAGLRFRGNGADFNKTKAQTGKCIDVCGVFVQACC